MTVHTSSGEDLARYLGQDTLLFCSANDEWKKIFFFFPLFLFCLFAKPPYYFLFFLQHTTWSHTLCTDAKETEELSRFILGKDDLAVNTARVQKPSFVFATSEVFGKVLFLV